jgi:hypothetical protein
VYFRYWLHIVELTLSICEQVHATVPPPRAAVGKEAAQAIVCCLQALSLSQNRSRLFYSSSSGQGQGQGQGAEQTLAGLRPRALQLLYRSSLWENALLGGRMRAGGEDADSSMDGLSARPSGMELLSCAALV